MPPYHRDRLDFTGSFIAENLLLPARKSSVKPTLPAPLNGAFDARRLKSKTTLFLGLLVALLSVLSRRSAGCSSSWPRTTFFPQPYFGSFSPLPRF